MKKHFAIIVCLLLALTANAQLLWKISGNGSLKPSYIFGTHHLAPESFLDSVPGLQQALHQARKVYGEMDMQQATQPAQVMAMQKMLIAPPDSTLDKVLSPRAYNILDSLLTANNGMPLAILSKLTPAAVSAQLSVLMAKNCLPDDDESVPLDVAIQTIAREQNIAVSGLETMAEQAELLFGQPIAQQAAELEESLTAQSFNNENIVALTTAYLNQDFKTLEKLVSTEQMTAQQRERLLWRRNIRWAEDLSEPLKQGNLFIAVGAAHLTGPLSVIERLRKMGFDVTPVTE